MATYDQAWAEAAASAPDNTVFIDTLEVTHASFTVPIRVCNSFEELVVNSSMIFKPWYFTLELPQIETNIVPQLIIKIANLNKELRENILRAGNTNSPANVQYRQYRVVGTTVALGEYMQIPLPVNNISIPSGATEITITCEPINIVNLPLHRAHYTLDRFPGLRS